MIKNNSFHIDQSKRVKEARDLLLVESPFYASILLCLDLVEDEAIQTFCVNSKTLRFNPSFANELSLTTIKLVLRHEVGHLIYRHHLRGDSIVDYNHNDWNISADLAINSELWFEEGFPQDALVPGRGSYEGFPMSLSAEEYYALVHKAKEDEDNQPSDDQNDESQDDDSSDDQSGDNEPQTDDQSSEDSNDDQDDSGDSEDAQEDAPATTFGNFEECDEEDVESEEEKIQQMVCQAIATCEEAGEALPSDIKRNIDKLLPKSVVPWKAILRNALSSAKTSRTNWHKPSRRNTGNFIMPSRCGKKPGDVLYAVDVSGSVDEVMLNKITSEIVSSMTVADEIEMWFWGTEICGEEKLTARTKVDELTIPYGGGTRITSVFNKIKEERKQPKLLIVFTDMYYSESDEMVAQMVKDNRLNVLWLNFGRYPKDAPVGRIVNLCECE